MRALLKPLVAVFALIILFGVQPSLAAPQRTGDAPLADLQFAPRELRWVPSAPNAGTTLTIVAPDGAVVQREFAANLAPTLSIDGAGNRRLLDGLYTYELRARPILDAATRAALAAATPEQREAIVARLRASGALPAALVQTGSFRIAGGAFVRPSASEPTRAGAANRGGAVPTDPITQDVVNADDVIVQGSLCVGFDCVNNENFGFDTVRLKENNTRIGFDDTSATSGFAANDWQLTANDSASGGLNKFSIDDVTGAKTPFTIIAGAPSNALYLASSGNLGLGTNAPALDVHLNTTDTPALRLEQNNSGGFTAQTWDVAGNEANFFVRDVTGGSRLPFRIRPGAPTSSIDISAAGNVGIGTASPSERLHVSGNLRVEGSVVELSDVRAKHDFQPIDGASVLLKLRAVPITTWSYRADPTGVRHIGPTAQAFFAAFGFGADDRHIAPLDTNGVALAAIQELDRMVRERDSRLAALERENADLAARLARLEQLIAEIK